MSIQRSKEILMYQLKSKNDRSRIEYDDDLRLTFGTKAEIEELYTNGNMMKLNISIFTRQSQDLQKEISIVACYNNTIKEITDVSCNFWSVRPDKYVITNSKYVVLPPDMTVAKLFQDSNGEQMHELCLHNKHTLCFDISKHHEDSIEINRNSGNSNAGGSSDQKLDKKIMIRKDAVAKMDNAPEKFFRA